MTSNRSGHIRLNTHPGGGAASRFPIHWGAATAASIAVTGAATSATVATTGTISSGGQLSVTTVGTGLSVKEGADAKMGTATLAAGTVTVNPTAVTANSRIFFDINGGTLTNLGVHYESARTAGTSFTISSSNVLDASTIAWMLVEPA